MKFPKLKHATISRFLPYIILVAVMIIPIIIVANIKPLHDLIKLLFWVTWMIFVLVVLIRNTATLFVVDLLLAQIQCHNKARKQFPLKDSFSIDKVEKKLSRFGKSYDSISLYQKPHTLRYKSSISMTIFFKAIEKVVLTYHAEFLELNYYREILRSADANSKALRGKKKHILLDKQQKTAPLNRSTVVIIFAKKVDEHLKSELFSRVCKNNGDGLESAIIPCVIDLENRLCVFDSLRLPVLNITIPAKNRGISLIKKYVFNGNLDLKNNEYLLEPMMEDLDIEQSLWQFLKETHKELVQNERDAKKRFSKMSHKDIIFEDDILYIKYEDRGITTVVELDEEKRVAIIEDIRFYTYPKSANISKNIREIVKKMINQHFSQLNYSVEFESPDD